MQLQSVLFDTERQPAPRAPCAEPIPVGLTPADITRAALRRLPRAAGRCRRQRRRGYRGAARVAFPPWRRRAERSAYVSSLRRVLVPPAPPSSLLAGRSSSRRVLWTEVPLDDLKRAAKAVGGTVNDAYLAALAGALARYHDRLGAPVPAVPVAVPINRRVDGAEEGGNQWAALSIALPTNEGDAAARMRTIGESCRAARWRRPSTPSARSRQC